MSENIIGDIISDYVYSDLLLIMITFISLQGSSVYSNNQDMNILIPFSAQKLKNLIDHKSVLILKLPVNTLRYITLYSGCVSE